MTSPADLGEAINRIRLVDHHVHSVGEDELTLDELELALTEAYLPPARPAMVFDSQLGFALRNHCAPLLGLPRFASPTDYVARRAELGATEVNRRFLTAAGASDLLVDLGYQGDRLIPNAALAAAGGFTVHRIQRLEAVAERWLESDAPAWPVSTLFCTSRLMKPWVSKPSRRTEVGCGYQPNHPRLRTSRPPCAHGAQSIARGTPRPGSPIR